MIHAFDEYPMHQAALPIAQTVDGDPNRYDRYFFHGYVPTAGVIFVVALGVYPNRQIVDGALCVSHDGHQRSVFASGRMTADRATQVGPIRIEVVEPLRRLRVSVDAPEQGLRADLTFDAGTVAMQEPRQTMMDRTRRIMDTCRYTQFGRWTGSLTSGDDEWSLNADACFGTRDRSWGVRPLSGATPMAPPTDVAGIWWLWTPLQLDDGRCLHVAVEEGPDGTRKLQAAAILQPLGDHAPNDPAAIDHLHAVEHDVTWEPGTRRARRIDLTLRHRNGDAMEVHLEPQARVHMRGAGYTHLEWGHGTWHGESEVGGEEVDHADLAPTDFTGLHVQQLVHVTGDVTGWGIAEQLAIGEHAPSGLTGFLDPAP